MFMCGAAYADALCCLMQDHSGETEKPPFVRRLPVFSSVPCAYFPLHLTLTGTGVAAIVRSLMTIRRLIKITIRLIRVMVAAPTRADIIFSILLR